MKYITILYHKPIEGEAVSFEEYRKKLQGKFGRNYRNINFNWDCYIINLPGDIELAKVSTQICNNFILNKNYSVHLEFYLDYLTFSNLMSNILGSFKVFSPGNWDTLDLYWRTKWECTWMPSEFLEKLCIHSN